MTTLLLLSAALQTPAAPPPKVDTKPLGPAPRIVLLQTDSDGKVRIQGMITETRKVTVNINNNGNVERKTEDRQYHRIAELTIAEVEKLTVHTADGKEVNRATALEKLTAGTVVVVSSDGEKVDPSYLKAFKDDTLVLASPQLTQTNRVTPTVSTAVRAVAAPVVIQALPLVPAAPIPAPPPKEEKKDDKKDEKKDTPKKDEKKG